VKDRKRDGRSKEKEKVEEERKGKGERKGDEAPLN